MFLYFVTLTTSTIMKKYWTILFIIILIITIVIWFYKSDLFKSEGEYIPTDYEIKLIDYFKEIAFKSEYLDNPEKVTKWVKPMSIYVYKDEEAIKQMTEISSTIQNINNITSDGFEIKITEDYKKANTLLYLCTKDKLKEIAPKLYNLANETTNYKYSGYTYVEFKMTNFAITKALIFIDSESSIDEQKHSIVEELTQSIGLMNDSDKYSDSIFYEKDGIEIEYNHQYSKMDIALINFLYNPKMKAGFREKTAEVVIRKILKDENNAINR